MSEVKSAHTPEECREMLRGEIDEKVTSRSLAWAIGIVVVVGLGIATFVVASYSKAQNQQDKELYRISQLQQEVVQEKAVTAEKLKNIESDISEIKDSVKLNQQTATQVLEMMREQRNMRIEFEDRIMEKMDKMDNGD